MQVRVLGSAAGGGFPQWNCGCPNCKGVRAGTIQASPRTQASIAISGDGQHWYLLGASPEIRAQLESFAPLHPKAARHTPIAGVFLVNGDLDNTLGLLSLREWSQVTVYATDAVRDGFCQGNALNHALQRFEGHSRWLSLVPQQSQTLLGDLQVEAIAVAGKSPLYVKADLKLREQTSNVWNIGLIFTHQGKRLGFFPSVAKITPDLHSIFTTLDTLFLDGTVWTDTELIDLGLANVRAVDMAHLPVGGHDGSLRALSDLKIPRRIFIHINNTNPMLCDDSAQAEQVRKAGWIIANDGLEFDL